MSADGGHAVLRVTDTGVGIPPRLLPTIFDLFTQDERALDRAEGGLGLGLTLVRRITELHGGTVSAFSAGRGHGSEFVVSLPLWTDDVVVPMRESEVPAAPRLRCLVVEDNVDAARMLEWPWRSKGTRFAWRSTAVTRSKQRRSSRPMPWCSTSACRG
jgi:hypothetical protein